MTFSPPPDGTPTRPGESPPAGGGGHLDDLAAMLLADGQPLDPPLARHAVRCGLCTALVAAFRSEALSLTTSLSMDEAELAFLSGAGVPAQVAARAAREPVPVVPRDTPATLLAMLLTALAGYVAWLLVQPVLIDTLTLAQRSGALAVATGLATDWLLGLLFTFLDVFRAAEALPLLSNPTLPLAVLALLAWLAIWLSPRFSLPVARTGVA